MASWAARASFGYACSLQYQAPPPGATVPYLPQTGQSWLAVGCLLLCFQPQLPHFFEFTRTSLHSGHLVISIILAVNRTISRSRTSTRPVWISAFAILTRPSSLQFPHFMLFVVVRLSPAVFISIAHNASGSGTSATYWLNFVSLNSVAGLRNFSISGSFSHSRRLRAITARHCAGV